jgi:peptidoglycan/xylan/chitin deacetylase (PgdA/CDA1 family)
MKSLVTAVTVTSVLLLGLSGCADPDRSTSVAEATPSAAASSPSPEVTTSPSPAPAPSPTPTAAGSPTPAADGADEADGVDEEPSDAELAALGVNELGRVLVGEWHIVGDTDGEYRTSRDTLRAQLEELYDRGYRPVTQTEFLEGTFPIPLGTSPVLLTFDDSTRGQFALDDDGRPTPDSAVGIIEQFAAEHPGWRATAVFGYNFPDPFGDGGYATKLRWLVDNGYELSNHTVGHVNLATLSTAEVVANLAENQSRLHEVVPDAAVLSLTLPLGIWPEGRAAAISGTADDGTSYEHRLVYLVGSDPTRSPHHVDFDPAAIQRVPAHAVVGTGPEWFGDWLDRMDEDGLRFVSDGRADVVTYPAEFADVADVDPALQTRTYGSP